MIASSMEQLWPGVEGGRGPVMGYLAENDKRSNMEADPIQPLRHLL